MELFLNFTIPGKKYYKLQLPRFMEKLHEYGDIVKMEGLFGKRGQLFIYDPNDFENVFRNEGKWPLRWGLDSFEYYRQNYRPELFGNTGGLVVTYGEEWGKFRKVVNPIMMHPKTIYSYVKATDEIAIEFREIIKSLLDENNEVPRNFKSEIGKWGFESVTYIALNTRANIMNSSVEGNERAKKLITTVRDFFNESYELDFLPSFWRLFPTPLFKKHMQTIDTLTDLIIEYVNDFKLTTDDREESVFSKLLKIDSSTAVVMAIDMLIAGIDTTTSLLTSILYDLAKNPDKQEILRKEILNIKLNGDYLNAENLKNLPYLRAVVKETIRFHPIISGNFRGAGKNLVIKGYQIPKGTGMMMDNLILFQNENYFPLPNKYIPERWLKHKNSNEKFIENIAHPFTYLPFGFGSRTCIGKRFAQLEAEILVIRILQQFRVEWHHPDLQYEYKMINVPEDNLRFRFNKL